MIKGGDISTLKFPEEQKISGRIEELAIEMSQIHDDINKLESLLKSNKERIEQIKTQELAELMENEGFSVGSKFVLENGKTIIVKEFFNVSIPSETKITKEKDALLKKDLIEQKENCIAWLEEQGIGDIIKNKLVASFARGEKDKVEKVLKMLQDMEVLCKNEESVHPSTLKATMKERLANKLEVPFDLFNITSGIVVDIK